MKDPIERQMAIDALHVWFNINMVTEKDMSDHIHDLELIINHIIGLQKVALRKLPSAQPEQYWIDSEGNVSTLPSAQKPGKWVWDEDAIDWGMGAWVCSKCKNRPQTFWETSKKIYPLKWVGSQYCPNCGTKMQKGE